jgi:outer membrane protein
VNKTILFPVLLIGCLATGAFGQSATPPGKVGILNLQGAIAGTQQGQKAAADLQTRYEPRRRELEKRQAEIQSLREQLTRGSNTMSDDAKQTLTRDIDQKTKALNRETEDAQADFQQDQDRILQGVLERMQVVIDKYARDNGFSLILDISSQQSPVLYAATSIEITGDIVSLYDKNSPVPGAASAAGAPAAPAKPPVAPAKK